MKKDYLVEIVCALFCALIFTYIIFTWKAMIPEAESEAETEIVEASGSEGGEL